MVYRIEVGVKQDIFDVLGETKKRSIINFLGISIGSVRTKRVYTLDVELTKEEFEYLKSELFVNPVTQEALSIHEEDFDWVIEVGYKPGVTDNVGRTARLAVEDVLGRRLKDNEAIHTSTQYLIKGKLSRDDAWRIGSELLANELIENLTILTYEDVKKYGLNIPIPRIYGEKQVHVSEVNIDVEDNELMRISRDRVLALSLAEMKAIKAYFTSQETMAERRSLGLPVNPTDVEIEMLAQTWSEHCKHKIFNNIVFYEDRDSGETEVIDGLFKTYIKGATEKASKKVGWLVSVFEDNAGVVMFNDHLNVVAKVETHNTPSALEPYGGAMTGIVGVNRDILGTGKGAKPMFNLFVYCLGNPFYTGEVPHRMLHPRRIRDGVHKGVIDGGNQSGIPLVRGREVFDPRFGEVGGKPLVYCGTIGVLPIEILGERSEVKRVLPGDYIVMVGGRIGKDGIHGATFSSEELHRGSPVQAVQIGDPITQKRMSDFLIEARDLGLYRGITDNGAGGLSSSVGEMAKLCGGCEVWLDKAPLKYEGLDPWEILLSESQERMTLAVDPTKLENLLSLAKIRDVEASVIGRFTDSGKFHAKYKDQTVAYTDMGFLHEGLPRKTLKAVWIKPRYEEPSLPEPSDYNKLLLEMLGRLNICSIESKLRQYDHEVKGLSVVKPLVGIEGDVPSDASVSILEYGSKEGLIIAEGICPHYSDLDTYHMAQSAMDEAVRRIVSAGGRLPSIENMLCVLDNFCWCDPEPSDTNLDAAYKMAQLVRACKGLFDYATYFDIPFISGKDSMKNDSVIDGRRVSIPPTVLITALGKIGEVDKTVTMEAKLPGDLVYVLGETKDELGGSEYYRYIGEKTRGYPYICGKVPQVDLKSAKTLYNALSIAISKGLVHSAHTPTLGGLGVAFAKVAFGGMLGLDIDLSKVPRSDINENWRLLFSESNSRFIVTVPEKHKADFEAIMNGCVFALVGRVTGDKRLRIWGLNGKLIVDAELNELKQAWKKTLEET